MPKPPPEGVICEACGHFEKFPPYVYAHWEIPLVYACKTDGCGKRYEILAGTATLLEDNSYGQTQEP